MFVLHRTAVLSLCALGLVASAAAQPVLKVSQRWTPPLSSHESRVVQCEQPDPLNQLAIEDWICPQSGPIIRVVWWGTLSDPAQGNRFYWISIRRDNGNCQPAGLIYQACVQARARRVGTDCRNQPVYRLTARLPQPFQQIRGEHYWLTIAEDDERSIRPNLEDFRWSGHMPVENCPAAQFDAAGNLNQPIIEPCLPDKTDLAFALFSRTITGTIDPLPTGLTAIYRLELRDPATGVLITSIPVEASSVDSFFDVFAEVADGTYEMVVRGMGSRPVRQMITLAIGAETHVMLHPVQGDLNDDDLIDLLDLSLLLNNFGR